MTRLRSSGRLLAAVLLCLSCQSPEERFASHVARAAEYAEAGRLEEAALEYDNALRIDPSDPEINERMGHLLAKQRQPAKAARYYREAHTLDPERIDAAMHEAQLVYFWDRPRADALLAAALERAPDSPFVQRVRSDLARADGDLVQALAAAQRALELDPEDPRNWLQLGRVHQGELQANQGAGRSSEPALFEAALAAFDRADALRGGDHGAQLERARVLAAWGKLGAARTAHLKALELAIAADDRNARVRAAEATVEFAEQLRDRALRRRGLRELVAAAPERLDAWSKLVELGDARGGQGREVLLELLELRPDDEGANRLYADYLLERDRAREALSHLEAAAKRIGSPSLWDELVGLRLRRGQLVEARAALEALEDAAPDDPLTQRARARLAISEGRLEPAAELLRALAPRSDSPETLRLLALAEHRLGNLANATAAIDRAIALAPDFAPPALRLKGRIHHDAEEWVACYRSFRALLDRRFRLLPSERLMTARALYEIGQRQRGRALLRALLDEAEPLPQAAVEFARREGGPRADQAVAYLETANAREPGRYDVLEALADLDVQANRREQAIQRLDEAVRAGSVAPPVLLLRAQLLADANQLDRAESDALRAFEASPGLPGAVDLLLSIYRKQERLDEARRSFEEADAAGVLHAGARLLLARLYDLQGDTARARELFERIVKEEPRMAVARADLALLLARAGEELPRALELARGAQQDAPRNPRIGLALGTVYLRSELPEAALEQLRRVLSGDRGLDGELGARLHFYRGLTLRALERESQAAEAFQTALALDPNFPEADEARQQLELTAGS